MTAQDIQQLTDFVTRDHTLGQAIAGLQEEQHYLRDTYLHQVALRGLRALPRPEGSLAQPQDVLDVLLTGHMQAVQLALTTLARLKAKRTPARPAQACGHAWTERRTTDNDGTEYCLGCEQAFLTPPAP